MKYDKPIIELIRWDDSMADIVCTSAPSPEIPGIGDDNIWD